MNKITTQSPDFSHGEVQTRLDNNTNKTKSCWLWTGNLTLAGYGTLSINGKPDYVHRLSYKRYFGDFNKKLLVCHHCDNPACLNPEHLFLGTHQDNTNDMIKKSRACFQQDGYINPSTIKKGKK